MFIGFANFYQRFIQGFSKIAVLFICLLKITRSSYKLAPKAFKADDNKIVSDGGSKANKTVVNLSKNNKSRNLTCMPNIETTRESNFLTPDAKKIFNHSQLAFIKVPIL